MDRINKELRKLSEKERAFVKEILQKIQKGNTTSLDIKKLKGRTDIFRVRKGTVRIIYQKTESGIFILALERRNESTYRDF
ncbi:MAG: hypothetical protein V4467_02250 [Patescibacteria group bacterium]